MVAGWPSANPAEALNCACGLYLADPSAWLSAPDADADAN